MNMEDKEMIVADLGYVIDTYTNESGWEPEATEDGIKVYDYEKGQTVCTLSDNGVSVGLSYTGNKTVRLLKEAYNKLLEDYE